MGVRVAGIHPELVTYIFVGLHGPTLDRMCPKEAVRSLPPGSAFSFVALRANLWGFSGHCSREAPYNQHQSLRPRSCS
jgi:hypothetical protein